MTRWDDLLNDVRRIEEVVDAGGTPEDAGELESLVAGLNDGADLFRVILDEYGGPVEAVKAISVMPADELRVIVLHCAFAEFVPKETGRGR